MKTENYVPEETVVVKVPRLSMKASIPGKSTEDDIEFEKAVEVLRYVISYGVKKFIQES